MPAMSINFKVDGKVNLLYKNIQFSIIKMIILRQKEYSLQGTRFLAGVNKTVLRKSPMKAKRAAIKTQDKVLGVAAKGLNNIENSKRVLNEISLNPGQVTNKITESTLRHPISVGSNVVGKVTIVTNPTTLGLIPIGTIGTAGEIALRKYSPRYVRATDNLARRYQGSRLSKGVETGVNVASGTLLNLARTL